MLCFQMVMASIPALTGAQTLNPINHQEKEVKIGLLIPDPGALAARHGAELAIREANEAGR